MSAVTPTRRQLMAGAAATALAATVGPGLSACSGSKPGPNTNTKQAGGQAELPAYVAIQGGKPDLAPSDDGVQAGYFKEPTELTSSGKEKPGGGIAITFMGSGLAQVPIPLGKNKFWQELNRRLDADFTVDYPPKAGDYPAKLATAVAGNAVGDLTSVSPFSPPHLVDVLHAQFQDLTEFLAGDAVKEYPNLANLRPWAWKGCIFDGAIFTIPSQIPRQGDYLYYSTGIRDSYPDAPKELTSGADLLELAKSLTDPRKNQWAFASPGALVKLFQQMLGAPNIWRIDGGTFTSTFEVEETKKAIDLVKQAWDQGLLLPDAFSAPSGGYSTLPTGKNALVFNPNAISAVKNYRPNFPKYEFTMYRVPKYEGGGWSQAHLSDGIYMKTAVKKADPDKIRKVLSVVDWLAAPFGTEQYRFLLYGIDGWDSKASGDNLVYTPTGAKEITPLGLPLITRPDLPLIAAGVTPDDQRKVWDYEKAILPDGLPDPRVGLYSPTDIDKGSTLELPLTATQGDIIQGRKPMSAWDDAVKTWRKAGGDKIRSEYEEAAAAQ